MTPPTKKAGSSRAEAASKPEPEDATPVVPEVEGEVESPGGKDPSVEDGSIPVVMTPSADTVGAVGNRFGQSSQAAANFVKDFQGQAEVKIAEAKQLLHEANRWSDIRDEARAQEDRDEEQRKRDEAEKVAADERQKRLLDALEKIAERD